MASCAETERKSPGSGDAEGPPAAVPPSVDSSGRTDRNREPRDATGAGSGGGDVIKTSTVQVGGVCLFRDDTELSADCVETVPLAFTGGKTLLSVATYQLDTESGARHGRVYLYQPSTAPSGDRSADGDDSAGGAGAGGDAPAPGTASFSRIQSIDTHAVLDIKWAKSPVAGKNLLSAACSNGELALFELENGSSATPSIRHVTSDILDNDETLRLSLEWSPAGQVVCSQSDSSISLYSVGAAGFDLVQQWRAHEYVPGMDIEAWICAFVQKTPDCIWTGGDDSLLKGWDMRVGTSRPVFVSRLHTAGVCSLQSHPFQEHIMASGSYDEAIHLWDVRATKTPLASCQAGEGGGVWRLKWHRSAERQQWLLAACMRNGFQIIDVGAGVVSFSPEDAPRSICLYDGHESLAYGADWVDEYAVDGEDPLRTPVVATASFYDHSFQVWKPARSLADDTIL